MMQWRRTRGLLSPVAHQRDLAIADGNVIEIGERHLDAIWEVIAAIIGDLLSEPMDVVGSRQGRGLPHAPRTDPYVQNYRIRLLP